MGPIEVAFIVVVILFGAIGIVRGYSRELGVTTMLLIALFIIEFTFDSPLSSTINARLEGFGVSAEQLVTLQAWVAVSILAIVTFISYQGLSLVFPGSGGSPFLALLVGLLNGYLFAGSIWYYLQAADWPLLNVEPPFSAFYEFAVQLLPPAIFGWEFFILVAVGLLIVRVLK